MKIISATAFSLFLAALICAQQPAVQAWQKISFYNDSFSIALPSNVIVHKDTERNSVTLISPGADSSYVITGTKASSFMRPREIMRRSPLAKLAKDTSKWKVEGADVDVYDFSDQFYFLHLEIETSKASYSVSFRSKSLNDARVSEVMQSLKVNGRYLIKGKGEPAEFPSILIGEKLETSSEVLDAINHKQVSTILLLKQKDTQDELPPDVFYSRPLLMLQKPRPRYTDSARQGNTQGTIVLKIEFKADGDIGFIAVAKGLPNGLDQEAINAAKKIRFLPAVQDGKPVSVIKRVEYSFSIY